MPNHADKNFPVLHKLKMDVQPGIILCMVGERLPYDRDVWYYPVAGCEEGSFRQIAWNVE